MAKLVISAEMIGLWRTVRAILASDVAWIDERHHDTFMHASGRLHDLCGLGPHQLPPFFALSETPPRWILQARQIRDYKRAHKLALLLDRHAAAAHPAPAPEGVTVEVGPQEGAE